MDAAGDFLIGSRTAPAQLRTTLAPPTGTTLQRRSPNSSTLRQRVGLGSASLGPGRALCLCAAWALRQSAVRTEMAISAARSSSPSRTASGLNHREVIDKLAHLEGETSNALFEELANWNHQLQDNNVQFEEPSP
jgi:hypothetical protein